MKNNRIKIIFFLCAFTMLGSITNINAMKNSKEEKNILNKINDISTNQDKETQKDENYEDKEVKNKEFRNDEKLLTLEKQLKEFNAKFSQYSGKLTLLITHLDTIVFNNSSDSYNLEKKYLEKIKEDYRKQKEEIEKTKNNYNAFLDVILKNNKKLHYEDQINEISKIINEIEFKIEQIDKNLLSNPKFSFKESTNEKEKEEEKEESSFDIDSEGSVFNSSSSEDEKEKEDIKISKHHVKKYIKKVDYLKNLILNNIKKSYSNKSENNTPEYIDSLERILTLPIYADLRNKNNPTEFDIDKFAQNLKNLGIIRNIPRATFEPTTPEEVSSYFKENGKENISKEDCEKYLKDKNEKINKVNITIDEDLKNYLLAVLNSNMFSIQYEFNINNEPQIYLTQNDKYIEFSNNIDKFRKKNSYYIDEKIDEISEDINEIYNENNKFNEKQIEEIKNKFNDEKNSICKEIKEIFEDEIKHIFSKIELIDGKKKPISYEENMEDSVSDEETKNLVNELNKLIENNFKDIKNKTELKDAVNRIFKEAEKILKSHNFEQMKSKEIKQLIKNYIQMLDGHLKYFVDVMNYYSRIYKNIKKLEYKDLYNIAWLYFSVTQYLYLTKDSQEVNETKFLERLKMFNKNKIEYKLDEEDKDILKKAFTTCNSILKEHISNFFKEHANYEDGFKKQLSEIEKEISNLNEMQKLFYFKKIKNLNFKDLKFKDFAKNLSKNPESEENKKYKRKAIKKLKEMIENRNNLSSEGLIKAHTNLNKIEKFFNALKSYSDYDFKNMVAAKILKGITSIKYLNNRINDMIKNVMLTKINLQDLLINNKKINKELVIQELKECNKYDNYISKHFPIAMDSYKYYSDYKNDYRYFLIDELQNNLKTESENLQNSYNEFRQLKKDIFDLTNSLDKKISLAKNSLNKKLTKK